MLSVGAQTVGEHASGGARTDDDIVEFESFGRSITGAKAGRTIHRFIFVFVPPSGRRDCSEISRLRRQSQSKSFVRDLESVVGSNRLERFPHLGISRGCSWVALRPPVQAARPSPATSCRWMPDRRRDEGTADRPAPLAAMCTLLSAV